MLHVYVAFRRCTCPRETPPKAFHSAERAFSRPVTWFREGQPEGQDHDDWQARESSWDSGKFSLSSILESTCRTSRCVVLPTSDSLIPYLPRVRDSGFTHTPSPVVSFDFQASVRCSYRFSVTKAQRIATERPRNQELLRAATLVPFERTASQLPAS